MMADATDSFLVRSNTALPTAYCCLLAGTAPDMDDKVQITLNTAPTMHTHDLMMSELLQEVPDFSPATRQTSSNNSISVARMAGLITVCMTMKKRQRRQTQRG